MNLRIERLTERTKLAVSPHWNSSNQSLYYVDIFEKSIHKYDNIKKRETRAAVGSKQVSFIIPIEDENDHFIISLSKELYRIKWDGESSKIEILEKIGEVETEKDNFFNRFNHGKCDPTGRLWAGTMCTLEEKPLIFLPKGNLYSINSKYDIQTHIKDIRLSTGLAFDKDRKKMYHIDGSKGTIDQYDFDESNGIISNYTPIFTLEKHQIDGIPNGMAIDINGNLWIAIFNGSKIIQIDPKIPETLLNIIEMPVKQITSVAFGGKNYEDLFVTTGAYKFDDQDLPAPDNGALFKITGLGVKGLPAANMKLFTT